MKEEYKNLKPCIDMTVYRDLEKLLSNLCHKEIGITTAIDYIAQNYEIKDSK